MPFAYAESYNIYQVPNCYQDYSVRVIPKLNTSFFTLPNCVIENVRWSRYTCPCNDLSLDLITESEDNFAVTIQYYINSDKTNENNKRVVNLNYDTSPKQKGFNFSFKLFNIVLGSIFLFLAVLIWFIMRYVRKVKREDDLPKQIFESKTQIQKEEAKSNAEDIYKGINEALRNIRK